MFDIFSLKLAGVSLVVLIIVELLGYTDFANNSNVKRIIVGALSLVLPGVDVSTPEGAAAIASVIVMATGAHKVLEVIQESYKSYLEKREEGEASLG